MSNAAAYAAFTESHFEISIGRIYTRICEETPGIKVEKAGILSAFVLSHVTSCPFGAWSSPIEHCSKGVCLNQVNGKLTAY